MRFWNEVVRRKVLMMSNVVSVICVMINFLCMCVVFVLWFLRCWLRRECRFGFKVMFSGLRVVSVLMVRIDMVFIEILV